MHVKTLEHVYLLGPTQAGLEYRLEIFSNAESPAESGFELMLYVRKRYGGVMIGSRHLEMWEFLPFQGATQGPSAEILREAVIKKLG